MEDLYCPNLRNPGQTAAATTVVFFFFFFFFFFWNPVLLSCPMNFIYIVVLLLQVAINPTISFSSYNQLVQVFLFFYDFFLVLYILISILSLISCPLHRDFGKSWD
jgi:hypothetical protein